MVKQFEIKLDARSLLLLKQLETELTPEALNARVLSELSKLSSEAVGSVQRGMSGDFLATRTGNLRRSVAGRAEQTRLGPAIRVGIFKGPSLAYAGVQEFGTQGFNPSASLMSSGVVVSSTPPSYVTRAFRSQKVVCGSRVILLMSALIL